MAEPIGSETESAIVERLRSGDSAAYEAFVREHAPRMLAVAGRFFNSESDRDDAVQDAFISAYRAIGSFDGQSKLATWLHRITVNACLMKNRSRSRKSETPIEELLPQFDETGHRVAPSRAWDDDGYTRLAAKDMRQRVRECIDRLPEVYRTVLLMRDIEGLDTVETAKLLDCSEANVKTRLHRARQALRTLLEPFVQGS